MTVNWSGPEEETPARALSRRSMDAVCRKAKDEWLALFAPDAFVQDPVGPSPLDEDGKGHHGLAAISTFWDNTVAHTERFEFTIRDSFAAGDEVANVGTITSYLPSDQRIDAEGVFVYRATEDGRIHSLRAFWEFNRALTTLRPA
ncbi:nuclear transport factor 2 family protein [Pseudonocardia spinosispora]|uniref:nuclear transport factor 2 family protein n=1 Tax=Pseudonocardia spinosispora TaxID=103441 RepID=UPI000416FBDC|nr:nuclear transport factor 2 family protein [Pseudonocardia spinosispora]